MQLAWRVIRFEVMFGQYLPSFFISFTSLHKAPFSPLSCISSPGRKQLLHLARCSCTNWWWRIWHHACRLLVHHTCTRRLVLSCTRSLLPIWAVSCASPLTHWSGHPMRMKLSPSCPISPGRWKWRSGWRLAPLVNSHTWLHQAFDCNQVDSSSCNSSPVPH